MTIQPPTGFTALGMRIISLCPRGFRSLLPALLLLLPAGLSGCVTEGRKSGVFARSPDLVFRGTVADIRQSPLDQSLTSWVVTFRVDELISGEYQEEYFSFLLHSPDRFFLEEAREYRVEALKVRSGYLIDPNQWALREQEKLESDEFRNGKE